jgi:hypothetical protein
VVHINIDMIVEIKENNDKTVAGGDVVLADGTLYILLPAAFAQLMDALKSE